MEIKLTKNQVAIVDVQDFEFLSQWTWCASEYKSGFRAVRGRKKSDGPGSATIYLHRIVAERAGLDIDGLDVDHKNDEGQVGGLDNRRCNLRPATRFENNQNKDLGKSGVRGVCLDRGKWKAHIKVKNKFINLGRSDSKPEAAKFRKAGESLYFTDIENGNEIQNLILLANGGWNSQAEIISSMIQ